MKPFHIIDISQPVNSKTACFPGDVPFSRNITVNYETSGVMNLTAFTMSPHVGTHADAPLHVRGSMADDTETAGNLPLEPFMGPAAVIDISPWTDAICWEQIENQLVLFEKRFSAFPERILFKTAQQIRYDAFEERYAWLAPDLIRKLAAHHIKLVGLDTPSVDAVDSKTLETHHVLLESSIFWLENLDFSQLVIQPDQPKCYFLVAQPLKFTELEASPIRAVLLDFSD
jgi:arylformamidase